MTGFIFDDRLLEGSEPIGDLPLCAARLQADARFAWIVLTPRRPGLRELEDLDRDGRDRLMTETLAAGGAVRAVGAALGRPVEKLNIGALGNVVPQLHVHVVGRRADDPAWPGPVWGFGAPQPYEAQALALALTVARKSLGL